MNTLRDLVLDGKIQEVKDFLANPQCNINEIDEYGTSPIWYAALSFENEIVKILLNDPRINIMVKGKPTSGPIKNNDEYLEAIKYNDAMYNILNGYDNECIHRAAKHGCESILQFYLKFPVIDVNFFDSKNNFTALIVSIRAKSIKCIRVLLADENIDVNIGSSQKNTPLSIAVESNYIDCVKLMLPDPRVEINKGVFTPLYMAVQGENIDMVQLLLTEERLDVNKSAFYTPLGQAIFFGNNDACVKLLLADQRIDVNKPNGEGHSPLMSAIFVNKQNICRLLLAHPNLNVNQIDPNNGKTALFYAVRYNAGDMVKILVEAKNPFTGQYSVDRNITDEDNESPLEYACKKKYVDIIKLLLSGTVTPQLDRIFKGKEILPVLNHDVLNLVGRFYFSSAIIDLQMVKKIYLKMMKMKLTDREPETIEIISLLNDFLKQH